MTSPKDSGSSIVEALAATVVISVGVLAIALLTGGIVRGNRESDRLGTAVLAAANRIEGLLAGVPLNLDADLAPGPHPPDQAGSRRYEALDGAGLVVASSVPASSRSYLLLRRWEVTAEASPRCLRRVRVSVRDPRDDTLLASTEALANCP